MSHEAEWLQQPSTNEAFFGASGAARRGAACRRAVQATALLAVAQCGGSARPNRVK
jgi:hypothetical protein